MKRRLAAMMMVVVLTGGSVMGCAGSGGSASAPDQGTAEAVSAQAAGEAAPAGSEDPDKPSAPAPSVKRRICRGSPPYRNHGAARRGSPPSLREPAEAAGSRKQRPLPLLYNIKAPRHRASEETRLPSAQAHKCWNKAAGREPHKRLHQIRKSSPKKASLCKIG